MPTAWASSPEEIRPCFRVDRIFRRFSSASADRMSDMGTLFRLQLFQIFLK